MFNKKSVMGNVLINGITKKEREEFKRKNKVMLKKSGYSIRDFDRHVLLKAMKNPKEFM